MVVKLRDHQIEAVAAIVRGLDIPPGGIPWNGLRGQVHAVCGIRKGGRRNRCEVNDC